MAEYKRYPFLLRPMKDSNISINKELLFNGRDIFINKNGSFQSVILGDIINVVKILADDISKSMGSKYTSLTQLIDEHNKLGKKIELLETGDEDSLPLQEILDKYKSISLEDSLKKQIDGKMEVNSFNGVLSDNDFTDELKSILDSIDFNVKRYDHPIIKQCNYIAPVQSVFERTGDVVITKEDFGLGEVEPDAIKYIHPRARVCNPKFVSSVNKLDMADIKVSKGAINLGVLDNNGLSRGVPNIEAKVNNRYLVYDNTIQKYINDRVTEIKKITKAIDTIKFSVTIYSYPIGEKPSESINIVTIYTKELIISRLYGNNSNHVFELPPGEYNTKVEGFNDKGEYVTRYKILKIGNTSNIVIDLKEGL